MLEHPNNKPIIVLSYNILFGMQGNTLKEAIKSHIAIHGLQPFIPLPWPNALRRHLILKRSIFLPSIFKLINSVTPDIVCINEILKGRHEKIFKEKLSEMGFKTFAWGESNHYKEPFNISTLLATKLKGFQLPINIKSIPRAGGGGGACAIFIPLKNLLIVGLHLSINKNIQKEQIHELESFVMQHKEKKIIIAGDFNCSKPELLQQSNWFKENFFDSGIFTCPFFKIPFELKTESDLDHVFFNNKYKLLSSKSFEGSSDHRALLIKLNEN